RRSRGDLGDSSERRGHRLEPDHLQGPDGEGRLRPGDVRDLVQDDGDVDQRARHHSGRHAPLQDRRLPAGLRSDEERPVGEGGARMARVNAKARRPSRKLFVAMAGNIGAGKTTAAKMISQKFGYELFDEPVIDNRFLKHYYGDMRRWSFTLQLEFLIKRVDHH